MLFGTPSKLADDPGGAERAQWEASAMPDMVELYLAPQEDKASGDLDLDSRVQDVS